MHQAGGVLSDPSAAMGLLWARRGLMYWVHVFRDRQDGPSEEPGGFRRSFAKAYKTVMEPVNGWVAKSSSQLAMLAVPLEFPTIAPTDREMEQDLRAWVD